MQEVKIKMVIICKALAYSVLVTVEITYTAAI